MDKKYSVGLDSGSRTTKIVLYDADEQQVVYHKVTETGINPAVTADNLFSKLKQVNSLKNSDILAAVSTGYGRNVVGFANKKKSEITCHARGVNHYFPNCRTVIDIGGQDSKIIDCAGGGKVTNFAMNDKCAAGTGRFLEVVANIMHTTVDALAGLGAKSKTKISIDNTCVVFAESEIIGLLSHNTPVADIVQAVHFSVARRIKNMAAGLTCAEKIVFTGGVSLNKGILKNLENVFNTKVYSPKIPSVTGAVGAAIIAAEQ